MRRATGFWPARNAITYCCPVSPLKPSFDDLRRSGQQDGEEAIDPKDILLGDRIVGTEHVTFDGHNPGAIEVEPLATPPDMTPAQWAKHAVSHLPYHPGCSICRACKRPNTGHIRSHEADRTIPLLVGDYAFCRDSKDESLATLLILRLFPYKLIFAFVVPAKGPDPLVVARLAKLITDCGLVHFAYRSDKEPAIIAMIQEACSIAGRHGVHVKSDEEGDVALQPGDSQTGELREEEHPRSIDHSHVAVPEHSHPGESQSNGLAEKAVQDLVNHVRVLKLALETNINARIPSNHPIMAWLVEHAAYLLNRCMLGTDGRTAWGRMHGKEATERLCQFGEKVLWYVPKKSRAKLDVRWRHGIFLGRSMNSDQNFIGLPDGSVTGARAMVRLVPKKRWDTERTGNISATPMDFKTRNLDIIEQGPEPHAHSSEDPANAEDDSAPLAKGRRIQVTPQHLQEYGYTPGCHRCLMHRQGQHARAKHSRHNETCRNRIYAEIRSTQNLQPEEEQRLAAKAQKEPKRKEAIPEDAQPDTPKATKQPGVQDASPMEETGDHEAMEHQEVRDVDASEMEELDNADVQFQDSTEFSQEVDDAMEDTDHETEMVAMMDVLQTLGVDVEDANRFCSKAVRAARCLSDPSFVEVYGTGRIVESANGFLRNLNLKGLDAFDLRTKKEDGTPWDFSKTSDRKEALRYVQEKQPTWVVGSPPCTAFSRLQGLNFSKMSPDKVQSILKEGRRHLHFVISLYKIQLDQGRHFLHEHPQGATSWHDAQMEKLLSHVRVNTIVSDQCQYGLLTPGPNGQLMPAKKPTKWASTSPQMLARLSARCPGDHVHQHLIGGRAADAAFYPPELVTNILRGMRDTADAECNDPCMTHVDMTVAMARAGSLHDIPAYSLKASYRESDLSHQNAQMKVKFRFLKGHSIDIDLDKNFREMYKDEYTTEPLPKEEAKAAIYDELAYFCDKVFRGVSYEDAVNDPEGKIIGSRWVNCNKGDKENPDVRMRLVAQEMNTGTGTGGCEDFYAATPPLEAKRLLFSEWATKKARHGKKLKLSFVDIRKAYFNGTPTRNLYVRLPTELGLPKNVLGKLVKCMYGTRDAGAIWEQCYVDCLIGLGFKQGVASPCCFEHKEWGVSVVVHGDDFTALGTDESLNLYEAGLQRSFDCKIRGRLGTDATDMKEIRILNRIVRIVEKGLVYEADPRHVELLVKALGMQDCKPVATPGIKKAFEDECMDLPITNEPETIDPQTVSSLTETRQVSFCDKPHGVRLVTPYSEVYGLHPSRFIFDAHGKFVMLSKFDDPFTGVSRDELVGRKDQLVYDSDARARILRRTLLDGPDWEEDTAELIAKISPKKFKQKRIGVKAAKKAEFESKGEVLNDAEATQFRALAARANFLAMDRTETSYATKELCRFFATPTMTGVEQLKRLVRYLAGAPRLVWEFYFQDDETDLTTYVDTDFGGCHVTRRSTSGGAATRGNHLIKHWSTTQTTVALSSAEAELTGICKGAAQSLGLQSLAADLGILLKVKIMTDATAAIGIARRRGLGKVRHLATADLWIQDRLRKKDFLLEKIPGSENPADMLTKHVDRSLLHKHMSKLGLHLEGGRADSAPNIDA